MLAMIVIQGLTAILTVRSFVLNPPYIPKNAGAWLLEPYPRTLFFTALLLSRPADVVQIPRHAPNYGRQG